MRVAGPAAPPQADGRTGLGPALAVSRAAGRPVVVDLGAPGVRGDDPRGRPPLLQGIRSLDALPDLVAVGPRRSVRRRHGAPWKTGNPAVSPRSFSRGNTADAPKPRCISIGLTGLRQRSALFNQVGEI